MSLFFAELRKVWGGRVFPALLAILAAANLLLLWMGTRPTAKQPPASAYRAVGAELSDKTMEEKGTYLHDKYTEIESLVKIGQYYREQAYGGYGLTQYRQDNAAMFDAYEQEYTDKTYTLFTDNLNTEYRLFSQLQSEYDTVAAYNDFLEGVQTKAAQLSGISIFQNDRTGYDLKNIELTAQVYAGLTDTPIDYYPQKGLYTAISQFICNEPVLTTTGANCMTGNRNMILDIRANLLNRLCLIQACQRNGIAAREVIRTSPVVAIGLIIVVRKIRNGVTLIFLPRCQVHTTANRTAIIDNPRTISGIILVCIYGHRNGGTATRTAATAGLGRAKLPNLIVCIGCIFPRQSSTARIGCRSQVQVVVDHLDAVQIISCVNGQKVNQSIVKVARDRIEVTNTPCFGWNT